VTFKKNIRPGLKNFLRVLIDQITLNECFINVTGRMFVHNFASTLV